MKMILFTIFLWYNIIVRTQIFYFVLSSSGRWKRRGNCIKIILIFLNFHLSYQINKIFTMVVDEKWMLVTELVKEKRPKSSPISQSCRQRISPPTSVTNTDVVNSQEFDLPHLVRLTASRMCWYVWLANFHFLVRAFDSGDATKINQRLLQYQRLSL